MRKFRETAGWTVGLAAALLLAGCCSNPGIFGKIRSAEKMAQGLYQPLYQDTLNGSPEAKVAIVAADTTLLLAHELQKQWCPDPGKAAQLELQAQEAKRLAGEAGVK